LLDERTIVYEGGVQRGECVLLERRDLADEALCVSESRLDRASETGHADAVSELCIG
jgi:hypothetical protein